MALIRFDGADLSRIPGRIAAKIVVQPDGCWYWMGARMPTGHGTIWFEGKFFGAHRFIYALLIGEIQAGLILHHECKVSFCVNPNHLQQMTRKEHAAEHPLAGAAAINAAKMVCKNGHAFNDRRKCLICHREVCRRAAERKRQAA